MRSDGSRFYGATVSVFVLVVTLMTAIPASEARADAEAPWVDISQITGVTSDEAAASCWEIKQFHPDSPSGVYWLLTPTMTAPEQFWCDQETDGGGWVKVGHGREGWEYNAVGKGSPAALRVAAPAPNVTAAQLSTATVDGLLNSGSVTALTDGVRVRRALNTAGTEWQEVRFTTLKDSGWYWSFGAGWTLRTWRVGTSSGSGGVSGSFGSGTSTSRVDTSIGTNHNFTWGFSYGNGVTGSNSADSYLWTPTNGQGGARPFAEVYIRPMLLTTEFAYTRIGDSGLPKSELEAVPMSNALTNPWGVTGIRGAVQREGDVEVQDLVAIGNTMYVAGNFRYVQQNSSGSGRVEQSFLAAFNATTGQYISSFAPTFNEAVIAVAETPNGSLAVGGKFTSVNGTAVTGFAVINPSSGALVGSQPTIMNGSTPGSVRVETITANGDSLYLGGAFTHTTGPTGPSRYTRNVSRINATTLMPNVDWRPEFNGTVLDSDASPDGTKMYFSGFPTRVGTDEVNSVAALPIATPAALDTVPWNPTWSSTGKFYQRAIVARGDYIYVGGSEHSMFSFDASTYERITTHVTNPKGDFQTLLAAGDFLYGGSHSNWFIYEGATFWPSVGTTWTRSDTMGWINAWKIDGVKSVSTFSPMMNSRLGSGGWASAAAPDGTVWTGGDFTTARVTNGGSAWTGAFVRFALSDATAPNTPTNLRSNSVTASTVQLAWGAPSGGLGGGSYQILRDNKVIASTTATNISVPLGGERRYYVRAVDSTGNTSATTAVFTVPGGNQAPVPLIEHTVDGFTVSFEATSSTDDSAIAEYYWDFGDGATSTEPTVEHTYALAGTYSVRLTVVDDMGAWATAVEELVLEQPRPTDEYGALVFDDIPWLYWRLDETSGTSAADSATGTRLGTYQQGVSQGVAGISGSTGAGFDGANDVVVAKDSVSGPNTFSAEVWFNTTTTRGGKLIGFGNNPSGTSNSYDRHIYMQNDGRLVFGVYVGGEFKVTSNATYNDGDWHHAVATLSPSGMVLYVDGQAVGTNSQTQAEGFTGYWRVGGDTTWGSTSAYFAGTLDEAAVYDYALTVQQVSRHYTVGMQIPNQAPVPEFSYTANNLTLAFDASASTDLDGSIAAVSWDFGDGSAAVQGAQVTHSFAAAGAYSVTVTVTDNEDESASLTREVTVEAPPNQAPSASFSHSANHLDVTFDASASGDADGSIASWSWSFGDTTSGTGKTVSHTYVTAGEYEVTLTVTDDDGATATATQDVVVVEAPNAAPTAEFSYGATFLEVNFDGTASADFDGTIEGVTWDFGDGSQAVTGDVTDLTQVHIYDSAGSYEVSLTVVDDKGDSGTTTRTVTVAAQPPNTLPLAEFTHSGAFLDVHFDGSTSSDADGSIVSWAWSFGDESESGSGPTVEHSFAQAGAYTVTLTVTDDEGGSGTVQKLVTIVEEPENQPPVAQFTQNATFLGVNFDGSTSSDADGTIATWTWDFGDGSTGSGVTASRTYAAAGTYVVRLTVTDNAGAMSWTESNVTVVAAPNVAPIASFTSSSSGLIVSVDGTASSDPDGSISSWDWEFGDGASASGPVASHTYGDGGTFVITLTVTDSSEANASVSRTIVVTSVPAEPTTRDVIVRSTSWSYLYSPSAPPTGWAQRTFNDAAWATGEAPIGYGSTLVVTNLNPVSDTADRPRAVFFRKSFDVDDVSKVVSLELSAIGDDGVVVYVNGVEVGRNNMRDGAVTYQTYAPVARRVAVAQGDMLTIEVPTNLLVTGTNVVAAETHLNYRATPDVHFWATASLTELSGPAAPNQAPLAAFTWSASHLDASFDAATSADPDGTIESWAWSFGDGTSGSGSTASHSFASAGVYDVTLTVTDDDGAVGTSTSQVTVTELVGVPVTTPVVTRSSVWSYLYANAAPPSDWAAVAFNPSGWETGTGPIGYGSTLVATNLNPAGTTNDRPRVVYFRTSFEIDDVSRVVSVDLSAIGDDGAVVYVNGVEVGRVNMRAGVVTYLTYAPVARRVAVAQNDLLTVEVPRELLVNGTNVIAAETHVNYRATPDVHFWAEVSVTEVQ